MSALGDMPAFTIHRGDHTGVEHPRLRIGARTKKLRECMESIG
jgi:hypothetical protein